MMLEMIMNEYNEKSWLRLCTLHNIDKWQIIKSTKKPVFPSKSFINKSPPIFTQYCFNCNEKFDLSIYKGNYIAKKNCQCGHDGTNLMTLQKLMCFYSKDDAIRIMKSVNFARRAGFNAPTGFDKSRTAEGLPSTSSDGDA